MNTIYRTVIDGLTYQGNVLDCAINYVLIGLTTAPFLLGARRVRSCGWLGCFLTAVVVQVMLWFGLDAVGVSVVWATMAGYALMGWIFSRSSGNEMRQKLFVVAVISASGGIVYYALTLPAITTVAHMIAVLMGIGLFCFFHATKKKAQGNTVA